MRRTKIVCTLGPGSSSPEVIHELIEAGMDVARLNFSHGTQESHAQVIAHVRAISEGMRRPVAILQDLQGPKIRLGTFQGGRARLETGAEFLITTRAVEGTALQASTTYDGLPGAVKPGDRIFVADGLIELTVLEVDEEWVRCLVVVGGEVGDRRGVNLPGAAMSARSLTAKDRDDLRFGLRHGVDFVAASFIRDAADVLEVRAAIHDAGTDTPVIAKLEKPEAIRHLDDILRVADGVMIARGDLGVELPLEDVPLIQKAIIRRARELGIPVITATQMLESMVENPRPTRAEVSDVANAILDGTDALMLSAETAVGKHPAEAVRVMVRIAGQTDRAVGSLVVPRTPTNPAPFPDVISDAACRTAREVGARAIVVFTQSGATARLLARFRLDTPILALCPSERIRRHLCLSWGIEPKAVPPTRCTDELVEQIEAVLLADKKVQPGDALVVVAGAPMWVSGTTNLITLHRVTEARRTASKGSHVPGEE